MHRTPAIPTTGQSAAGPRDLVGSIPGDTYCSPSASPRARLTAPLLCTLCLISAPAARAQNPHDPGYLDRELATSTTTAGVVVPPHMPETDRERIHKLIVTSGMGDAEREVDGTYGQYTPGLVGGIDKGMDVGRIAKEIGGVPIYIPIPGVALPGAIVGGLVGLTQQQIQDFRDALTEDLIESDSPPLRTDGLAIDAFWEIRRRPEMESQLLAADADIPKDADAVLYADFDGLAIDVQGKDAIITTSVVARVYSPWSGRDVYVTRISYQDRDTLEKWTANDNALWRSYQNFARYFLGRAVADDVFNGIEVVHSLVPTEGPDTKFVRKKGPRHLETEAVTPTLSWQLSLDGGGADASMVANLDPSRVAWDLEIFDSRQLVYDAKDLDSPSHTLDYPLEPCTTYRWSVRPVYLLDSGRRYGDWMRFPWQPQAKSRKKKSPEEVAAEEAAAKQIRDAFGKGLMGRRISESHAYTQDFATIAVSCRK